MSSSSSSSSEKIIITVTGAGGYAASHIVKQLLERENVIVRGTVRSSKDESKIGFLKQLPGAAERLQFFEADLMKEGSFDEAIQGAHYVIHTASPFLFNDKIKNPNDIIEPALVGTRNVLNSASKSSTVKRVVLTASQFAVHGDYNERGSADGKGGHLFTEDDWNETSSPTYQPYPYSKVVAEKEAWKIANAQSQWDLIVINPSFILGPTLSGRNDSTSTSFIMDYFNGVRHLGVADLALGIVDVRDVARAHVAAVFNPAAKGRYICYNKTMTMIEVAKVYTPQYSQYPLPCVVLPKFLLYIIGNLFGLSWKFISNNIGVPLALDNSKIKRELGIEFTDINSTLIDMVESLFDKGLLVRKN